MVFGRNTGIRVLDNLYDGLYLVDRDMRIIYWNKAAERISGFTGAEVVGTRCADNVLVHSDDNGNILCKARCPLAMAMRDQGSREADVFLKHKEGHRIPVSIRVSSLVDDSGATIGGIQLFSDISSRKIVEARVGELEKLAMLDNLTGVANRGFLERDLGICLEACKRVDVSVGVLFIDVDYLKGFNDTYGHDVGDEVLRLIAQTLKKNSRPFDAVGRWGGDEFMVIVRNVTAEQLREIGNRLRVLVENAHLSIETMELSVTISSGATIIQNDDSLESLVKRADTLLYASKNAGRNCLTLG